MSFRIDIKKTIGWKGKITGLLILGWGIGSGGFLNFENEDRAYAGFITGMSRMVESDGGKVRKPRCDG